MVRKRQRPEIVFPTGVGMNRKATVPMSVSMSVPHGRGDEPNFMLALSEGTGRGGEHVQFCLWKTKKGRTFMQPFFKTNPLWVSGEVFIITSWNHLASPRGFEPLSTA